MVKQNTVNLSLAIGANAGQKEAQLHMGKCVRLAAYITGNDPAEPVNISIKDTDGNVLVEASHYKDWQRGGGEYIESMKAVNFNTRNVVIHVISTVNLTAKLDVQIFFLIDTSKES